MGKSNNVFTRINQSESFEQSREDILKLAEMAGMRDTISFILDFAETDHEIGMAVAKVFDTFAVVPTMKWLPADIKAMYHPLLYGVVPGETVALHSVKEVARFIYDKGLHGDVIIMKEDGTPFISTFGIFIDKIADMKYREELLKELVPLQMGM